MENAGDQEAILFACVKKAGGSRWSDPVSCEYRNTLFECMKFVHETPKLSKRADQNKSQRDKVSDDRFDDILSQPIPERLKNLIKEIRRLEGRKK